MKKNKQKNKQKNAKIWGVVALVAFVVATVLTIVGFSRTVVEFEEVAISKTPTAILASAGVSEDKAISLPVMYYDQAKDECVDLYDLSKSQELYNRQFEWSECGYKNKELEQGLLEFELNKEHEPVAMGGKLTSNRGVKGDNFERWFTAIDGKSASYPGVLKLDYKSAGAEFSFYKSEFYPLDSVGSTLANVASTDGHNHLFTMNFAVPFTVLASGGEGLMIAADDDTFVYVGDKLVIDMGGVHEAMTGQFVIHEDGEVYSSVDGEELAYAGVKVDSGASEVIRIFHADRDAEESTFNIKIVGMNLTVVDAKFAGNKDEGVQVAYDPSDPSYVAPLGESSIFQPDNSRGLIIMATILGVLVVVFSLFMMIAIRILVKRKQ